MKRSVLLTVFLLSAMMFFSPKKVDAQIIEVGVTGGLSYYNGDLNPGKQFYNNGLALGGVLRYYDNMRWAFRFQYSNMSLQAADETGYYVPAKDSFTSKVNDFALLAEFNFFDYWTGSNRDFFTPYLMLGFSVFNYNSTTTNLNGDVSEKEPATSFSIPFGLGFKYSLTNRIGVTLEWMIHKSAKDNIDAVEDNFHTEYKQDGSEEIIKLPLAYRCDWYSMLGLSVVYRFNLPKKADCNSGIKPRK